MDPLHNPFAPGAGASPPELAGRDEIIKSAETALQRIRIGRPEKSQMLLGLRGVGKTVLLNRISESAEQIGYIVVNMEAPEGQRLVDYLAPALKGVLMKLSKYERAKDLAARARARYAASPASSRSQSATSRSESANQQPRTVGTSRSTFPNSWLRRREPPELPARAWHSSLTRCNTCPRKICAR